jgi:hypothetical protein
MRHVVFRLARLLGRATGSWRGFPIFFIINTFLVLPLLLLGITSCFEKQTKGFTALGIFLLLLVFGVILCVYVWWRFSDGERKFKDYTELRFRRAAAIESLADELDYLRVDTEWCKNEIGRIKDFAGLAVARIEEGRPAGAFPEEGEEIEFGLPVEEDDRVSLFESCQSRPWREILFTAAGSIRSELQVGIPSIH